MNIQAWGLGLNALERQEHVTERVLPRIEFCLFCIVQVKIIEAGKAVEIPLTFPCLLEISIHLGPESKTSLK